jgi:hypothetical protein
MWPNLPYELIGRASVVIIVVLLALLLGVLAFMILYALWYRGLTYIINLMWKGYDIQGEHPPKWRREVAIYCHLLQTGDWEYVERIRKKLENLEDDE